MLKLREKEDLTQEATARRLGVHQSTVSRIERAAGRPRRGSFSAAAAGRAGRTERPPTPRR